MRVCDLAPGQLQHLLGGSGLRLRTGPFVTCIRSSLDEVRDGVALHYGQHPVESDDGFADFEVAVDRKPGLRRWLKPQVRFLVDGEDIFTPLPGDQGFPMLEWGLNWCVSGLAHQYLTLHAAVLEREGGALILPAPSGSGKSTLCAGLLFNGWRLLSDELTLIEPDTCRIVPLPRPVSLKNASIDVIRAFAPQARFGAVVEETLKGRVAHFSPPHDAVSRAGDRAAPGWIALPRYVAGAATNLQPLGKGRAMMRLVESAFNYNIHARRGFAALADLVERSDCFEFTYSSLDEAVQQFERLAMARAAGGA